MTLKKINILEYVFGVGGGGHQKAYAVYAFINVDNCERSLSEDRSKYAWIAATWSVEAGVGSIRTHPRPSTSPRIGPRRMRQERRSEPKTLDDSKQTANWGQSVQSIHEEVGTGGQCGM